MKIHRSNIRFLGYVPAVVVVLQFALAAPSAADPTPVEPPPTEGQRGPAVAPPPGGPPGEVRDAASPVPAPPPPTAGPVQMAPPDGMLPPDARYAPRPDLRYAPAPMRPRDLHKLLLLNCEDYRVARKRRLGGTLTSSIGGGIGLTIALVGALAYAPCDSKYSGISCDGARTAVITGLVVTGVSLVIGIPLAISGSREMTSIRNQVLQNPQLPLGGPFRGQRPDSEVALVSW